MATESIDTVDATPPVTFAYGARPSGYGLGLVGGLNSYTLNFSHRPAYAFPADPAPPPAYVEGFLMSGVRMSGARATWVASGSPDLSGTYAPGGSPLVLSTITIVKRGFNAA